MGEMLHLVELRPRFSRLLDESMWRLSNYSHIWHFFHRIGDIAPRDILSAHSNDTFFGEYTPKPIRDRQTQALSVTFFKKNDDISGPNVLSRGVISCSPTSHDEPTQREEVPMLRRRSEKKQPTQISWRKCHVCITTPDDAIAGWTSHRK